MLDAMGQELVLGATYGYSSTKSGFATTVVGTLKKIGDKKVTLDIIERRHFLYGKQIERGWMENAPTTSCHGCILFRLK